MVKLEKQLCKLVIVRNGKVSIFSGHLFCKDCSAKLYYCTTNKFTPDKDFYRCSNYKNNSTHSCTSHTIKDHILKELVYQQTKLDGKKFQQIDIYYAGVGIIGIPLTEYELEDAFQQNIKNTKTA